MLWTSALAIYILFWFLCLFLVLPFHGRRGGSDAGAEHRVAGQDGGAPSSFPVLRVAGQVTLLAAFVFGLYYAAYVSGYFSRDLLNYLPSPPPR